jgi:hypothetical protein
MTEESKPEEKRVPLGKPLTAEELNRLDDDLAVRLEEAAADWNKRVSPPFRNLLKDGDSVSK